MGTTPEPDRIWITRNGVYSKVCRARPVGEACTEYAKVREIPAAAPKPDEKDAAPAARRDHKVALNRAAKPAVRKGAGKREKP